MNSKGRKSAWIVAVMLGVALQVPAGEVLAAQKRRVSSPQVSRSRASRSTSSRSARTPISRSRSSATRSRSAPRTNRAVSRTSRQAPRPTRSATRTSRNIGIRRAPVRSTARTNRAPARSSRTTPTTRSFSNRNLNTRSSRGIGAARRSSTATSLRTPISRIYNNTASTRRAPASTTSRLPRSFSNATGRTSANSRRTPISRIPNATRVATGDRAGIGKSRSLNASGLTRSGASAPGARTFSRNAAAAGAQPRTPLARVPQSRGLSLPRRGTARTGSFALDLAQTNNGSRSGNFLFGLSTPRLGLGIARIGDNVAASLRLGVSDLHFYRPYYGRHSVHDAIVHYSYARHAYPYYSNYRYDPYYYSSISFGYGYGYGSSYYSAYPYSYGYGYPYRTRYPYYGSQNIYYGDYYAQERYVEPAQTEPPAVSAEPPAKTMFNYGHEAFLEGNFADAQRYFLEAMLADEHDSLSVLLYSFSSFAVGDYQVAASALRRSLISRPDFVEKPIGLRPLYPDEAILQRQLSDLVDYAAANPEAQGERLLLAFLYYSAEAPERALPLITALAAANPDDTLIAHLRDAVQRVIEP